MRPVLLVSWACASWPRPTDRFVSSKPNPIGPSGLHLVPPPKNPSYAFVRVRSVCLPRPSSRSPATVGPPPPPPPCEVRLSLISSPETITQVLPPLSFPSCCANLQQQTQKPARPRLSPPSVSPPRGAARPLLRRRLQHPTPLTRIQPAAAPLPPLPADPAPGAPPVPGPPRRSAHAQLLRRGRGRELLPRLSLLAEPASTPPRAEKAPGPALRRAGGHSPPWIRPEAPRDHHDGRQPFASSLTTTQFCVVHRQACCICATMASLGRRAGSYICSELCGTALNQRCYSTSRVDWKQLRPMILKRINKRSKEYPIKRMIPVAEEVVRAREIVNEGVSRLLKVVPVQSCKFCPEVYIGAMGHQLKTCYGFKRMIKDRPHEWGPGNLNDILVPVQAFHQKNMFEHEIKHDQRFDFTRVPAVLELCHHAGAHIPDEILYKSEQIPATPKTKHQQSAPILPDELRYIGQRTLDAWEALRLGVTKLLLVYPSKVCKHCSEVHIGQSGHKARMCGVFKFEGWKGMHKWNKAGMDDLIPQKIVWHRRPHDPPVLVDGGRDYYGHAPAVIELCMQVGAIVPPKYHCMMKTHGLAPPV